MRPVLPTAIAGSDQHGDSKPTRLAGMGQGLEVLIHGKPLPTALTLLFHYQPSGMIHITCHVLTAKYRYVLFLYFYPSSPDIFCSFPSPQARLCNVLPPPQRFQSEDVIFIVYTHEIRTLCFFFFFFFF